MTNFESLPLELVMPIVKASGIHHFLSKYFSHRLLALATISPPFHFCATTLLYEDIAFNSEQKAQDFLATRDERYVVKSIRFLARFNPVKMSRIGPPDVETAVKVVRICTELEGLRLSTTELYAGLIHEPNLKNLNSLTLDFVPSTTVHSFAFPSLRKLKISNFSWSGRCHAAGVLQLLQACSSELKSLDLPAMSRGSEAALTKEISRFAKTLTSLTTDFDITAASSPFYTLFKELSALRSLFITASRLGLLRQLLSELPNSTLTSLHYRSESPFFLRPYPSSAGDLEAVLSLPQLNKLEQLQLNLFSRRGDDDEGMVNPPGDEDGRFVACMERWEAKGLEVAGADQWGLISLDERDTSESRVDVITLSRLVSRMLE